MTAENGGPAMDKLRALKYLLKVADTLRDRKSVV